MPSFRSTLRAVTEDAPKRFKITCVGRQKSGPNVIEFEIDAPDQKTAANTARRIIMLGKYTVEPA